MSTGEVPSYKVVLVGDAKVGKTSVLGQWARKEYSSFYEPTVSPELTTKDVVLETQSVRLQVWDIGFGEPDTVAQFPSYARGAAGVMLMYDLSDSSSVDGLAHWREQVKNHTGPKSVFVIVGCKSDLPVATGVKQKAKAFCECFGFKHIETSAQTSVNIASTFALLATECLKLTQTERRAASDVQQSTAPPPMPSPDLTKLRQMAPAGRVVKLVLLGDARVGKSCLAQRVGGNQDFEEEYIPTAGPEILTQNVYLNAASSAVKLQIWDVAGNDILENSRISTPVLQGVQAAMVVFDVTSRSSFESLDRWFRLLEAQADPNISVILIATKVDSLQPRMVAHEEGRNFAEAIRVPYAEVSSRTGSNCANIAELLLAGGRLPVNWEVATAGVTPQAFNSPSIASTGPAATADKGLAAWRRPPGVPAHLRPLTKDERPKVDSIDTSMRSADTTPHATPKNISDGVRHMPQVPQFGTGDLTDSFPGPPQAQTPLPVNQRAGSQRIVLQEAPRQPSPISQQHTLSQTTPSIASASRMGSAKMPLGADEAKNWTQRTAFAFHANAGANGGSSHSQQQAQQTTRSPPPFRPGSPTSRPGLPQAQAQQPQAQAQAANKDLERRVSALSDKEAAQRRYPAPVGAQDAPGDPLSQSTQRLTTGPTTGYPPAFGRGGLIQPNSAAHLQRNSPTPLAGNRVRRAAASPPPAATRPLGQQQQPQLEQQSRLVGGVPVGGMGRSPATSVQVPLAQGSNQAAMSAQTGRAGGTSSPRRQGHSNYVWR